MDALNECGERRREQASGGVERRQGARDTDRQLVDYSGV